MIPGKDIERQIAIMTVVTMKEALLLSAVQRVIGRIDIQYNLLRRIIFMGADIPIGKQAFNGLLVKTDLMIAARRFGRPPYQPLPPNDLTCSCRRPAARRDWLFLPIASITDRPAGGHDR